MKKIAIAIGIVCLAVLIALGVYMFRTGVFLNWIHRQRSLVAVMVENHERARPFQEGIGDALMIWEFPVEGMITRFAVVFDASALPERIGPVRSLRPYFVDALRPWVPAVIFAGGSPEAFAKVGSGQIVGKNLLYYYGDAERDPSIAEPHNLFVRAEKVTKLLQDASLPATSWPPYFVGASSSGSGASQISINWFNPAHNVRYTYSTLRGAYVRESGDVADQGHPHNILFLEMPVTGIGEAGRLTIPVTGHGRALLFRSGTIQEGRWKKGGLLQDFSFEDRDGGALVFAPGQTWVTVVPELSRVKWQ